MAKIKDLPSPIRLNIQYIDKQSEKTRDLAIFVALGSIDKGKGKKYSGPKFINIDTKGAPIPVKQVIPQHNKHTIKFDPNFDFRRVPEELVRITSKVRNKKDSIIRFTESQVMFTFTSLFGCSIKVTLIVPETAQQKNKNALKNRKAELLRLEEDIEAKFTVADPYYKEMVDLV